jgi:hypothetical protein
MTTIRKPKIVVVSTAKMASGKAPSVGDYMAGRNHQAYRILGVTMLRQAGSAERRYRLSCICEPRQDVPAGAVLHPWRLGTKLPPKISRAAMPPIVSPLLLRMGIRDREMLERLQFRTPLLLAMALEPIRTARAQATAQQRDRVARVGRDRGVVNLADFGAALRLDAVRTRDGTVLREADVLVHDEPEEPGSRRRIRRARRADPLDTLLKHGSINRRQHTAAMALRGDCEAATPKLPSCAAQSEVHAVPWARLGVTPSQLTASAAARDALACLRAQHLPVVIWIVGGGTITGYVIYARVHRQTATERLRAGLSELANHYYGQEEAA